MEDIVVLQVFYADVKIALRAARTDRRSLFLEEALCPCGGMKPEEWIRALRGGEEEFLALLERQNAHGSRGAAEALAAVLAEHPPAIWEAVPHREARRRADHRGERCLPVTAAVCRIWEAFSADRAIWKTA